MRYPRSFRLRLLSIIVPAALVLGAMAAAQTAAAATLDAATVPPQAGGVIHVDVEAMQSSRIYKQNQEQLMPDISDLDIGPSWLSMDVLKSTKDITIWLLPSGDLGAIVARGLQTTRLVEALPSAPGFTSETYRKRKLYSVGEPDDRTWLAVVGTRAIAAESREHLVRTIDVLEGRSKSISPAKLAVPRTSTIIFAAFLEKGLLGKVRDNAESSLLSAGQLERMRALIGERRSGKVFVELVVDIAAEDEAVKLEQIAQGAIALGNLVIEEETLKTLLQAVRISRRGTTLTGLLELEPKALRRLLEDGIRDAIKIK